MGYLLLEYFVIFIYNPYMFRTSLCLLSGGTTVYIYIHTHTHTHTHTQHLELAILNKADSLKVTIAFIVKYENEACCLQTCNKYR